MTFPTLSILKTNCHPVFVYQETPCSCKRFLSH